MEVQKKYECCGESFKNFREYVCHLEKHDNKLVDVPEPLKKPSFFKRLFQRDKPEVVSMAKEEETKQAVPQVSEDRLNQLEGAINQVTNMMGQLQDQMTKVANEKALKDLDIPAGVSDDEPAPESSGKKLKFTVMVPEKESGEFLKTIQDNTNYEMEDVEVIK